MEQQLTTPRVRPVLDEGSFQQLLAAAYVLQEQNDRFRAKDFRPDHSQVLSEIVDTQKLIQGGQLELQAAAQLIVERVQKITNASGAAVGLLEGDQVVYRAASGIARVDAGAQVGLDSCISADCLRGAETLRRTDREIFAPDSEDRGTQAIKSLIAVPVFYEGKVAGVLELRFSEANSFHEPDIRTSQLMAGLVTEAIARSAEVEWKQALAVERASMLETLERIKPQLERLVEPQAAPSDNAGTNIASSVCRGCGNQLGEEESFCGICGLAQKKQSHGGDIQSKWASLWHLQQAAERKKSEDLTNGPEEVAAWEPMLASSTTADDSTIEADLEGEVEADSTAAASGSLEAAPVDGTRLELSHRLHWTSAARARQWLESLRPRQENRTWLIRQWQRQRANFYLGTAIILFMVVLAGWDTRSALNPGGSGSAASTMSGRQAKPRLTLFEKMLVALNLAEAPPTPIYLGNPNTQVWVDLHTALYYCPGSDLYGKTVGGKFSTQREAQGDQFQSASRRACD